MTSKRYETHDASALGITVVGIAIVVGAVIMHASLYGMFRKLRGGRPTPEPGYPKLAAAPPDYQRFYDDQMKSIHSYRWVDKKAGFATIPIERAMELMSHGH